MKLSGKGMDTFRKLEEKAEHDSFRMPPINRIHELLEELNITHFYRESVNIVEYRSKGKVYVNSRHQGKKGFKLTYTANDEHEREAIDTYTIELDTSDSYYSFNTRTYAQKLIKLINLKTQTQ